MIEGHVIDLLPAYALGCLDKEDDLLVAEHLAACKTCRREMDSYARLVADLPYAMRQSDPPPDLKEKILRRARAAEGAVQKEPNDRSLPPYVGGLPSRPTSVWTAPPALWQRLVRLGATPAWSLLSLVLVLGLGASNLLLWGRLNSLETRSPAGLLTVHLQGTDAAPKATGLLVISLDGTHGTMVVDQLPALGEDSQYQLWLIWDGKRTSGGVFSVDEKGYKSLYVASPEPLVSYSAFGVTIEPAGGSPGPTGAKVLGGEL